MHENMREKNTD